MTCMKGPYLQRYSRQGGDYEFDEDPDGRWVYYDEAAEALRQAQAEIVMLREILRKADDGLDLFKSANRVLSMELDMLREENGKIRAANADQAKRLAAYRQDARESMARSGE